MHPGLTGLTAKTQLKPHFPPSLRSPRCLSPSFCLWLKIGAKLASMVTTKIGKRDYFWSESASSARSKCFWEMFWLQRNSNEMWPTKMKSKISPAFSFSPVPSQTMILLGCHQQNLPHRPIAGHLLGNINFSCSFVVSFKSSKSALWSRLAFLSPVCLPLHQLSPFLLSDFFAGVKHLFQMYIKAIQPCDGLCSVIDCCHLSFSSILFLLFYFPCGVSYLACRPSDERDCEACTVIPQSE